MVWTDEYKKAIERAVRLTGVDIVSAGMKDEYGIVGLHVNCDRKENMQAIKKNFFDSLRKDLGEDQPFLISTYPTEMIIEENVVYGAGSWWV